MTRRSANKPLNLILTSALWMAGFLFVAAALSGTAHAEQQNPDGATTFGYVANAFDNTVSVIDTATKTVVATINLPVGAIPKGVATTPDGTRAYVINDGNFTVSVIDTSNNTVVNTIPADDPSAVAVTPDGTHAYVTNQSENTVSVIDIASNTLVATIPVGKFPDAVAFIPNGPDTPGRDVGSHQSLAYVTNFVDSTVSVIDTTNNAVVATIPVGANPDAVAITPDGTHAYVANGFDNTCSVIDTASNAVVDTIPVGGGPEGIAITPDGTRAYVANGNDNTVAVINTAHNKVVATIQVGPVPAGIAITPDRTPQDGRDDRRHQPLAYVTNFCGLITCTDNTVSVIDTARNKVVATIQVGQEPIAVAFATVIRSYYRGEQ